MFQRRTKGTRKNRLFVSVENREEGNISPNLRNNDSSVNDWDNIPGAPRGGWLVVPGLSLESKMLEFSSQDPTPKPVVDDAGMGRCRTKAEIQNSTQQGWSLHQDYWLCEVGWILQSQSSAEHFQTAPLSQRFRNNGDVRSRRTFSRLSFIAAVEALWRFMYQTFTCVETQHAVGQQMENLSWVVDGRAIRKRKHASVDHPLSFSFCGVVVSHPTPPDQPLSKQTDRCFMSIPGCWEWKLVSWSRENLWRLQSLATHSVSCVFRFFGFGFRAVHGLVSCPVPWEAGLKSLAEKWDNFGTDRICWMNLPPIPSSVPLKHTLKEMKHRKRRRQLCVRRIRVRPLQSDELGLPQASWSSWNCFTQTCLFFST